MQSKTIWYVISHLGSGGTERHISTLIPLQLAQGHNVKLLVYGAHAGPSYHEIPSAVEIVYLGDVHGPGDKARLSGLRNMVRQGKPDVVSSWSADINVRVALALLGIKTRLILSEVSHPIRQPLSLLSRLLRLILYPTARAVVVQTKQVKRFYPIWLWRKIKVINNPINSFAGKTPQENKTIISAGRLSEEKCFDVLIDAFSLIAPEFPDWRLKIWGEGPERPMLEQHIAENKLRDFVDLPGNSATPSEWLGSGQIFAMCSQYEGFPNALGEAMAAGYPVVVTPFDFGPRDMIVPDEDGVIAQGHASDDLAQALKSVMADDRRVTEMGQRAKEKALRLWSKEKIAGEWLSLLD